MKDEIWSVTLWFNYLGCTTLVAHFFETAMCMWSGALPHSALTLLLLHRYVPGEQNTSMHWYRIWYGQYAWPGCPGNTLPCGHLLCHTAAFSCSQLVVSYAPHCN